MRNPKTIVAAALVFLAALSGAPGVARAQGATAPYPQMAPLDQYMIADNSAEIALARSAAPSSIADKADVMVLGPAGYTTAVEGTNGFLCIVERSWGAATTESEFWNQKLRAPICFNRQAAESYARIYLMKTKLVLAGKSKAEILAATDAALDSKELPALEPGSMCYMMSKQQYLNDIGKSWHPHLMFFVAGKAAENWGADQPGSPVISADDPEERVTIMMIWAAHWSDGSPAPAMEN
jgi:hypothetical protein